MRVLVRFCVEYPSIGDANLNWVCDNVDVVAAQDLGRRSDLVLSKLLIQI